MSERAHGFRRHWVGAAGLAAIALFAVLAGRFWHPFYGFTRFIQLDSADAAAGIHEIREQPVFVYDGFNGYDGAAYAQIAFHPRLDSPELQPALGNVPYRARRILGSALAWLLSGGDPARIANTYATLNLGVWLLLAALLWRVLPVQDARSWLAWCGVLFSAGALHSIRLALTDLLATTLVVAAVWATERGRGKSGLAALAAAGLARETALAAVVGVCRGPWKSARAIFTNAMRIAVVAIPLFAWIAYVRWHAGPAPQGFGNFTWPVIGWIEKWQETFAGFGRHPNFRWLTLTTLLAMVGLTVQAIYFARRLRLESPWWRVGASGVLMMVLLGTSVWEGHPGAATRVLLPMSAAFAILAAREQTGWSWIALGSLGLFSGVQALWEVPPSSREIAAGRFAGGSYVAQIAGGWFGVERHERHAWAWCADHGVLEIRVAPLTLHDATVRLKVRSIAPRPLQIEVGGRQIWSGPISEKIETIVVRAPINEPGRVLLQLSSPAAPIRENAQPDARLLGFAVYGCALE